MIYRKGWPGGLSGCVGSSSLSILALEPAFEILHLAWLVELGEEFNACPFSEFGFLHHEPVFF